MSSEKIDRENILSNINGINRKDSSSPPFPPIFEGTQFVFIDASQTIPLELSSYRRKGNLIWDSSEPNPYEGYNCREVAEPVILSRYQFHGVQIKHAKKAEEETIPETEEISETDEWTFPENDNGENPDSPKLQAENTDNSDIPEYLTFLESIPDDLMPDEPAKDTSPPVEEPSINLFAETEFKYQSSFNIIITDKKIYKPGENIRAAVFAPSLPDASSTLLIRHSVSGAEALYEEKIQLNQSGAGFCSFPGIEAGEYEMALQIKRSKFSITEYDKVSFSVAEYSLSLLEAKLHKYKVYGGKFLAEACITRLNSPFTGKISAKICDDKTGHEILSKELFVNEGAMSLEFELPPKSLNLFHLRIITEDGGTAEIHFPEKPSGVKNEISLGKLGNHFTGSIHPMPGSRDLGWFNTALSSRGAFPLELWEIYEEKAILRSTCALKKAQVVLINPLNGEYRVFDYNDVEEGREFSFEIDFPYTVIHAAAWGENPMESWGVVFRKSETGLELETPDTIEPGQEINIRLKSAKPVKCLLTITDSRVEREDPVKKAGGNIYKTIAGYDNLLSGEVKETDEESLDNYKLFQALLNRSGAFSGIREMFPEHLAIRYTLLPLAIFGNSIVVAMKDPGNILAIDDIRLITGYKVIPIRIREEIINGYIKEIWGAVELCTLCEKPDLSFHSSREILKMKAVPIPIPIPIPTPTRSKFPDVIHFEMFDMDGTAERTIIAGEQPGTWKCSAYAIDGFDFTGVEREILSTKECYVEIDTPAATGDEDEIEVKVRFNTGSSDRTGTLKLTIYDETITEEVTGEGVLEIVLTKPGEIIAEIRAGEFTDRVIKTVLPLRKGKTTINRIQILHRGEAVTGDNIEIYASIPLLIKDCIESLLDYPYGCAEQTSAKLYGLSIACHYAMKGTIDRKPEDISKFIIPGLNRLAMFYYNPGMFSLWERGTPSTEITAKVVENLIHFQGLNFKMADEYLRTASKYLKSMKYKSNRLLPLGREFLTKSESLCDLVNFCIYNRDSERIPEFTEKIKAWMQVDERGIYWQGIYPHYWAGDLEATCEALSALWIAGETDLCLRGITPIMTYMKEGRLYSTSDTVAFLRLLDIMDMDFSENVEITGEIISPSIGSFPDELNSESPLSRSRSEVIQYSDKLWVSGSVKAVDNDIIVRTIETVEVDYLDVKSNFPFTVKLSSDIPAFDFKPEIARQKPLTTEKAGHSDISYQSTGQAPHSSEKKSQSRDSGKIWEIPDLSELDNDEIYEAFLSNDEEESRKAMEKLFPEHETLQAPDMETNSSEVLKIDSDELSERDLWFIEPPPLPEATEEAGEKVHEIEKTDPVAPLEKDIQDKIPPIDDTELSDSESEIPDIDSKERNEPAIFHLTVGQKAALTITPLEWSLCPLCRILLPGNLALLKSGGNVQQACVPIKYGTSGKQYKRRNMGDYIDIDGVFYHYTPKNEPEDNEKAIPPAPLTVEIAAVRKGKGKIYVALSDMYDSGKKGLSRGVEVLVE